MGLPWLSRAYNSSLSVPKARVRCLLGELRSHKSGSVRPKKREKKREREYQEALAHNLDPKQAHGASYSATTSHTGNGSGFHGHKLSLTAVGVARHGATSQQKASTRCARGHSGTAQEPAIARHCRPSPPRCRTSLDSLPRPGAGRAPRGGRLTWRGRAGPGHGFAPRLQCGAEAILSERRSRPRSAR